MTRRTTNVKMASWIAQVGAYAVSTVSDWQRRCVMRARDGWRAAHQVPADGDEA